MICVQRTRHSIRVVVAALLLGQFSVSTVSAQTVSGTVSDAQTGLPVGSGFIVLLDRLENEVARALWSRNGSFSLRAPAPGVYALRTERIGYRAFVSAPLEVRESGAVNIDLAIAGLPIQLATIEVTREDNCRISPEQTAETALVWEEIRKALAAASWTESEGFYHTVNNVYERDLDGRGRRVYREQHVPAIGYTRSPFVSRDPELLAREGYMAVEEDGSLYFAPDAVTLQDESFLRTHCFWLQQRERDGVHLLGLAFEPARGRDLPDVEGVLWLDQQTSELRLLEFSYTNLPYKISGRMTPGGSVEFLPLPGGAWIVHRWQIDLAARFRQEWVSRFDIRPRRVLDRRRETGGEVLTVSHQDGSVVYQAEVAELTGVLFDSMTTPPKPMAGAVVQISGTWFADTTDQSGRFRVRAPLDGEYSVSFTHPRTDSIGFFVRPRPVTLARGRTDTVELVMPRMESVMAELCPNSPAGAYGRVLVGTVSDSMTGAPAAGAQVAASWQLIHSTGPLSVQTRERVVSTDENGRYAICGLEFGRPAFVYAVSSEAQSQPVRVCFEAGGVEVEGEFHETSHGIWRTDLELSPASTQSAVLAGAVSDATTGEPVPGALVTVEGFEKTGLTDGRGLFRLAGLPPGRQRISLEASGYRTRWGEVDVEADQPTLLNAESLTLSPMAQVTGTITEAGMDGPVPDVWVTLVSDSGIAVAMTRSDDRGRYSLSAPDPGAYLVVARRIGYSPSGLGPFKLETGRSVDVNISLSQFAVALDPVTVTAEIVTGYLEDVGFYRRQRTNAAGRFLDRADIEERLGRAGDVAELLTGVMGVEVGDPVPGSFGASLDFQRGQLSMAGCPLGPRIYLDGLVIENRPIGGNHIALSGVVRPEEVFGIEVYRSASQIPIEYGGAESACGVLVIWTINGRY